jgi:hypothetical protein
MRPIDVPRPLEWALETPRRARKVRPDRLLKDSWRRARQRPTGAPVVWPRARRGTPAPSRQVRQRDSTLPSRQATTRRRTASSATGAGAGSTTAAGAGADANFHTLTNRATTVIEIRTNITHRIVMSRA